MQYMDLPKIPMNAVIDFLMKHGYSVLFGALFAHQIGLPVPGPLFLIAAGALAATGKMGLIVALVLAVLACVLADWPWYEAGRRYGDRVLHFLHRLTRDPDGHTQKAKASFARYGLLTLIISKFVPGLDAVTPPLAGTSGTARVHFLSFDAVGAALYSCAYAGLGYMFSHDLDRAVAYATKTGSALIAFSLVLISFFVARYLFRRYRLAGEFAWQRRHELTRLDLNAPSPLSGDPGRI